MKRSVSAAALRRVRKFSDSVRPILVDHSVEPHRDAVVSVTTNRPRHTKDDSFFDYGGKWKNQPLKGRESNLKRSLSHRNIRKDDIRPYLLANPSQSTHDLWVGGGEMKNDVEPRRPHAQTPLRSRFSADTEDLDVQAPRGRKADKKVLDPVVQAETQRPSRPPRPADEDLLKDVYGQGNAAGFAPPAACAVREHLREERGRQKNMGLAAAGATTARPGELVRHRGPATQGREALARRGHDGRQHTKVQADEEVGPPVPPKDDISAKMSSPFAPTPSRHRLRTGPDGVLTRKLSSRSAPDGTSGVSKVVPMAGRPVTLDERREPLDLDELYSAIAGHGEAPRPTGSSSLYRSSSLGNTNTQASTHPLQHPHPRPLDRRDHRTVCPDERKPRPAHAEYRPQKPSPLGTRQPSVVPLSSRTDAYLPEPLHKRRPSEMDVPHDVRPEDGGQVSTVRRPPMQIYATVHAPAQARAPATARAMQLKLKPLPPSPVPSTRTMAKGQGSMRPREVPRPIQMSMTITTASPKGLGSYESDHVVIAPFSPATSLVSTAASFRDYHEEGLLEQLMTQTDDPRMSRRDRYVTEQLTRALAEPERVRPVSFRKKHAGMPQRAGRWQ
uniref:Mannitol dehydrogenase n=1 Tax=Ganoderma boninense TaxID=34458 RepID=A0A5K1K1N0_9APHY|nr:Mannitol dehydrogenase [Ganoderma boninense]